MEDPKTHTPSPMDQRLSLAIDQLLAHPEVLSMVASALGSPKAPAEEAEPSEAALAASAAPASEASEALSALAPLLSGLSGLARGGKETPDDPKACLLRALKPYVNPARREAIDTMIRLSQLSGLLGQII